VASTAMPIGRSAGTLPSATNAAAIPTAATASGIGTTPTRRSISRRQAAPGPRPAALASSLSIGILPRPAPLRTNP